MCLCFPLFMPVAEGRLSSYDRYDTQYNRYSQCLHQTHTRATSPGIIPDAAIESGNLLQPSNTFLPVDHPATRERLDGNIPIWSPTTFSYYPVDYNHYRLPSTIVPYYMLPASVIFTGSNMFARSVPILYQSPDTHQSSSTSSRASRQDLLVNGMTVNPDAVGHKSSMRPSMAGSLSDIPRSPRLDSALENHTMNMSYHCYDPPNEHAAPANWMRFELGNDVTLSTNDMVCYLLPSSEPAAP
ncbi:uncharacterized protein EV420DRAFT_831739 [Desarmillaria tabescens]|uniref:Uncharacterized protein n=1 Tax=Armillaria tabescens TaxID=1929756 RepID=A0AA39MWY3_ARMTA|nr:uncharacterized protein EV420DRAFT_831739 [Desarmillaria tabescens]KAK0448880.1 hypothetical protein EV420DRAFT_831739 [Desarmillaria tabescens]